MNSDEIQGKSVDAFQTLFCCWIFFTPDFRTLFYCRVGKRVALIDGYISLSSIWVSSLNWWHETVLINIVWRLELNYLVHWQNMIWRSFHDRALSIKQVLILSVVENISTKTLFLRYSPHTPEATKNNINSSITSFESKHLYNIIVQFCLQLWGVLNTSAGSRKIYKIQ